MRVALPLVLCALVSPLARGDATVGAPPTASAPSLAGCPQPAPGDRDGDGIPDAADKCPGDPETWNGRDDGDGCPDQGRVIAHPALVEVAEPITFAAGKAVLTPAGEALVGELAVVLLHACRAPAVEVQVHSDARGAEAFNRTITQARAEAIAARLLALGVPPNRVVARGYGEDFPLCTQPGEACWSRNRRTAIVLATVDGKPADGASEARAWAQLGAQACRAGDAARAESAERHTDDAGARLIHAACAQSPRR